MTISSMINKGLIARGRIFTFSVQLPDKPGQLEYVAKVLAQCNANVIGLIITNLKTLLVSLK